MGTFYKREYEQKTKLFDNMGTNICIHCVKQTTSPQSSLVFGELREEFVQVFRPFYRPGAKAAVQQNHTDISDTCNKLILY